MAPWGWECRSRLIKQLTPKPVEKRGVARLELPGPAHYDPPEIFCGRGYSKIKRAPAYSFGLSLPVSISKPAAKPNAPIFNVCGLTRKGLSKIRQGQIGIQCETIFKGSKLGPGQYDPRDQIKKPPVYTLQPRAQEFKEPWDMWTPGPNMYCPPIPAKREPAYSFGYPQRLLKPQDFPGPGGHDPKFDYVKKAKPALSFGYPFRNPASFQNPAPNTYCEKKTLEKDHPSSFVWHSPFTSHWHTRTMFEVFKAEPSPRWTKVLETEHKKHKNTKHLNVFLKVIGLLILKIGLIIACFWKLFSSPTKLIPPNVII